jgi:hypothetical protein
LSLERRQFNIPRAGLQAFFEKNFVRIAAKIVPLLGIFKQKAKQGGGFLPETGRNPP